MPVLSLILAAALTVDPASRTVRLAAKATGVAKHETIEFAAITPRSDRAYESLAVTEASAAEIAAALARLGVPRGHAVDPAHARFRPVGERLHVTIGGKTLDETLEDVRASSGDSPLKHAVLWTGGARDAAGRPLADVEMPGAVFALYGHGPSLLQFDGDYGQSVTYGRFRPKVQFAKDAPLEIVLTWNGRTNVVDRVVEIDAATDSVALVKSLVAESATCDLHVTPAFGKGVSVAAAARAAAVLAKLDGEKIKVDGMADGRFCFRAFLPDGKWRDRAQRPFQPFEIRLTPDGKREFTFVREDWSGPGDDPVLKPETRGLREWDELKALVAKTGEAGEKIDVALVFAPGATMVGDLEGIVRALSPRISTFYVFGD